MNDTARPDGAATAVRDWLIEEAGFLEHFGLVLDGLCERLLAAGLPLARATTHIRVVHSERIGLSRVWRRGQAMIEQHFGFGPEVEAMYQRSPIRVAHEEKRRFELRPDDSSAAPFGITVDLRAAGISHYVIFPLFFTSGHVNAASFATDRAGGFLTAELEFIERLLPALSRVMEIKGLQRSRHELLRIYVGKLPAERILDGQIRRGDVVGMDAAILLCDLRRSTQMAVELDEEAFVLVLNRYFDCVVPAVTAQGGEVLKFIGDAVLAIFELPARPGDCSHCDCALAATDAIFTALRQLNETGSLAGGPLEVTIALHEGRVAFGNIGSVERQDFTVIGQDVNLVARLGTLAAQLGEPLLLSERVASRSPVGLRKVGEFPLKGFRDPQSVFARAS
jgi:adenylate cyclase